MRYTITKVQNGLWRLEWENREFSEHSTLQGAEKMAMLSGNKEAQGINHERYAIIQAVKSIVPPPYMLQLRDVEALRQSGYTGTTALIENERRNTEYQATLDRVANYIDHVREVERERIVSITTKSKEAFMVPETEQRWLKSIRLS